MTTKLPVIGDEVLSPHDKFTDANGDLVWEQIGDTISTGSDKIRGQSGDYEFDALLNGGCAVDPLTHPELYAIMQTLPNDTQPAPPNQPFKTVADLT